MNDLLGNGAVVNRAVSNQVLLKRGAAGLGWLVMATVTLLLTGCAPTSDDPGSGTPSPTASVSPGSLVGTWVLPQTFDAPEQPYVSFVQDNTWSASDGCNRVQGTWTLGDDGALNTTAGPQTLMGCDGAALPLAVVTAKAVTVADDTLVLVGGSEIGEDITLVRSTDPLVGPPGRPVGYWAESNTPEAPFLSIDTDQSYSGSDGCNVLTGTWTQNSDWSVALTPGVTTLMMCEGVDQWLRLAVLGRVQAGVMTLQAEDGTVLGQLTRR
ncbi:MAG: META domain-containing protein [Cryobacterium sp.]